MKKFLACAVVGLAASAAMAIDPPTGQWDNTVMEQHRATFDSLMAINRATMDSIMALHQAQLQACRLGAEKAFRDLDSQRVNSTISRDSLEKIIAARRAEAQANLKLAVEDLRDFQAAEKAKIDSARAEIHSKLADREKQIKGGIDVALARLNEAIARLEAKKAATTDAAVQAKIEESIKHLNEIEAHLKAVQTK